MRRFGFNLSYLGRPPWDTQQSPPELLAFLHGHTPGRALDLGCGTGFNLLTMAQAGWQVTGIDFAWLAVFRARWRLARAGYTAEIRTADAAEPGVLPAPFDLILDIGCLHALSAEPKVRYIHRLPDLLAPGGTFLLYGHLLLPDSDGIGFADSDLEMLSGSLALIQRTDGSDRSRQSVWLEYSIIQRA